jgi:hypothetical protein
MPIIVSSTTTSGGIVGRSVRIPGLPDFNDTDRDLIVEDVGGYMDGPTPIPVLVPNGGGVGAVAVGDWAPAEDYLTVNGWIFSDAAALAGFRRVLLDAFTSATEAPLVILGNGVDIDKQMFVRLYDRRTISQVDDRLAFSLPLVAPDPYKYALEPLSGQMGVFTGQSWFRDYALAGTRWVRTYTLTGGRWVRSYERRLPSGPFPTSLTLTSDGDMTSRRVTAAITGPLTAGDWWLVNEATGERLWVEVGVTADQTLVLDMRARTARLNGALMDHLVFGDWLSLAPGGNTYRLVSGTDSDAYASIEALEAYQ